MAHHSPSCTTESTRSAVTEPVSAARLEQEIGGQVHVLHAARHDHLRVAGTDHAAASITALSPEPHTLLTAVAPTVGGSPAPGRPGARGLADPRRDDIAHDHFVHRGRVNRGRRIASRMAAAPRAGAGVVARLPWKSSDGGSARAEDNGLAMVAHGAEAPAMRRAGGDRFRRAIRADARFSQRGHEISVPRPARDDVQVDVVGHAGAGRLADVRAEVEGRRR